MLYTSCLAHSMAETIEFIFLAHFSSFGRIRIQCQTAKQPNIQTTTDTNDTERESLPFKACISEEINN